MAYEIKHDPGESQPLNSDWINDSEWEEPVPALKDVYATLSVASTNEKKETLPNLYE